MLDMWIQGISKVGDQVGIRLGILVGKGDGFLVGLAVTVGFFVGLGEG